MPLTASGVLSRLGQIVQSDKSQSDQARYLLPFILLMRLDSKLQPTRTEFEEASEKWNKLKVASDTTELYFDAQEAREITGQYFFSLSTYTLPTTYDAQDVLKRLDALVQGFSPRIRSLLIDELGILTKARALQKSKALYPLVGELVSLQKETKQLDDAGFGRLLSDLLQLLSEGTNDDASECATPQDVVELMVSLLPQSSAGSKATLSVYDPTYGTAGLLVNAAAKVREVHGGADVCIQGHEKRGEMHALGAMSALLQVSAFNGQPPEDAGAVGEVVDLVKGHSLKPEARAAGTADYAVCNPPQGKSGKWAKVKTDVTKEAGVENSRFAAGRPAVGDASLLFLQHVIDRLNGQGRAVLSLNGSPLFAGQVSAKGENEQAIRGWLLDHDYLDAIVALPPNVHFNTDIPTYLWVLDKNRPDDRAGEVILVNATGRPGEESEQLCCFARTRKKNQNKKRFDLTEEGIAELVEMVRAFKDVDREDSNGERVPLARVLDTDDFRFRVVKVHRPLRLHVTINQKHLLRLSLQKAWNDLASTDNHTWNALYKLLQAHRGYKTKDAAEFEKDFKAWVKKAGLSTTKAAVRKAILEALSERDLSAVAQRNSKGELVSDPELADEERVPWNTATKDYIDREVRPFVPEVDRDLLWAGDDELPGAEIPFNRIFYRYRAPRSLHEIGKEIHNTRQEVDKLLDALEQDWATFGTLPENEPGGAS